MDLPRDLAQVGRERGDALGKLGHVGVAVQIAQRLPQLAPQPLDRHQVRTVRRQIHQPDS